MSTGTYQDCSGQDIVDPMITQQRTKLTGLIYTNKTGHDSTCWSGGWPGDHPTGNLTGGTDQTGSRETIQQAGAGQVDGREVI